MLPGKQPPEGERKIYLLIEGPTENSVKRAKQVRGSGWSRLALAARAPKAQPCPVALAVLPLLLDANAVN